MSAAADHSAPTAGLSARHGSARLVIVAVILAAIGICGWYGRNWWRQTAEQQRITACREASLKEDWKTLQRLSRAWTEDRPDSTDAWLNLAEAEVELGRYEEGAEALGHVDRNDPRAAMSILQKATIEWNELNLPLEGMKSCKEALQLDPACIQAHAQVIAFYAMTFQRPQMLSAIRTSIADRGEPREAYVYLMLADQPIFSNAIDLNARWMASAPQHSEFRVGLAIQTALHRFLTATAEANTDAYANEQEALQRLAEFAVEFPGNEPLLSVLLDYYVEEGDEERVASLLSQVSDASVRDHIIWTARGWYLGVQGDLDGAEASIRNALKLHPSSTRAHLELANILRQKGRLEEATRAQALSARGVELRKQLLKLDNARDATGNDLLAIMDLCRDCGDVEVAEALQKRLEEMPGLTIDMLRQNAARTGNSPPPADQTSADQTSADQTSADRTSAGRSSAPPADTR
ncbi:MAG: tetratricopeptide repeat protein [Planctomycetaceae bacterium]|nr:tetratricopeptide repeat protein [Planctomycetaceae bacterium]